MGEARQTAAARRRLGTRPPDYERLGVVGISRPLYECTRCGAAVSDRDTHDEWHERNKR